MLFLSPFLLACGAVLAVPLWLHLRRKRRQTPVEFPSLRYLKMAAARVKRQARVEDLGLLVLRLLLVAALVAAFARPVVRANGGWLGTGRTVESVVVIDATASMAWRGESGSRLDAAKRLAREWVEGLDRSDAVALWILTDRLEQRVPLPITDRAEWFRQLDAVQPSEGSASLAPVFNAAREWAASRGAGRKELVVITDNQPAAWDWPTAGFFKNAWQRGRTSLVVLAPDAGRPNNLSVAAVTWDGRAVREGTVLTGVAKLVNHGDATANDLLECRVGGQVLLRKPVTLEAGGSIEVPLALPVPKLDGPVLAGELALAGDGLACDDHWHFALPGRRPYSVLVVDRGGAVDGRMKASFFLTKALTAGGAGKVTAIDTAAWSTENTTGVDAVWFTGGAVESAAEWAKAAAFAEAGGTVVVTGDSQPEPLPAEWPVAAGEIVNLPPGRIATRVLAAAHPLFAGIWSDQAPFPPWSQKSVRKTTAAVGATVLATLAGELPLLAERPCGRGRVLWLNASADRAWGDLPLSPVYVALVQQLARARELSLHAATAGWVGESWPDLTSFGGAATWPAAADGSPALRVPHSGVFDALAKDGSTLWRTAANVRREESELRAVDSKVLQAMLPGRLAAGAQGIREWREEVRREVPLWPWLLAAAAALYLTEGWLSAAAAKRRVIPTAGPQPEARRREVLR